MFKILCFLFLRKNKNDLIEYFFWLNLKILIFFFKIVLFLMFLLKYNNFFLLLSVNKINLNFNFLFN